MLVFCIYEIVLYIRLEEHAYGGNLDAMAIVCWLKKNVSNASRRGQKA